MIKNTPPKDHPNKCAASIRSSIGQQRLDLNKRSSKNYTNWCSDAGSIEEHKTGNRMDDACEFQRGVDSSVGFLELDFLEGASMPIRKYMSGATFGPEMIKEMTTAFERIRTILKLENPDDPLLEVVAKKIISLASQGTFDPKEIERLVIADTKRP